MVDHSPDGNSVAVLFRHWKKRSWKLRSRRKPLKVEVSSGKCEQSHFVLVDFPLFNWTSLDTHLRISSEPKMPSYEGFCAILCYLRCQKPSSYRCHHFTNEILIPTLPRVIISNSRKWNIVPHVPSIWICKAWVISSFLTAICASLLLNLPSV